MEIDLQATRDSMDTSKEASGTILLSVKILVRRSSNRSMSDRAILEPSECLNDALIQEAQLLLRDQNERKVLGWQSTQCCKKFDLFKSLPT